MDNVLARPGHVLASAVPRVVLVARFSFVLSHCEGWVRVLLRARGTGDTHKKIVHIFYSIAPMFCGRRFDRWPNRVMRARDVCVCVSVCTRNARKSHLRMENMALSDRPLRAGDLMCLAATTSRGGCLYRFLQNYTNTQQTPKDRADHTSHGDNRYRFFLR